LHIEQLNLNNFRLFEAVQFFPADKINLITGPNGSGKTSLIESIFMLARNRSFRTNNNTILINRNAQELIVSAQLKNDSDQTFKIGLKKSPTFTELHIAGKRQKRLSIQARFLPLGIITANTQRLITDGPKSRRKFLNWGVFHVEHQYADLMSHYKRILIQRNTAIRLGIENYRIWDPQLVRFGLEIHRLREKYLVLFQQVYNELVGKFDPLKEIEIKYKQGWNQKTGLFEAIADRDDLEIKYTYAGPHRADIGFYIGNKLASDILSNGQLKLLTILLILTQMRLIKLLIGERPILLFDDLKSEIDDHNKILLLETIKHLDFQTFITSIDQDEIFGRDSCAKMFHVKQGEIIAK
jgi:DNA replication and repair protein RecF